MRVPTTTTVGPNGSRPRHARRRPRWPSHSHRNWTYCRGTLTINLTDPTGHRPCEEDVCAGYQSFSNPGIEPTVIQEGFSTKQWERAAAIASYVGGPAAGPQKSSHGLAYGALNIAAQVLPPIETVAGDVSCAFGIGEVTGLCEEGAVSSVNDVISVFEDATDAAGARAGQVAVRSGADATPAITPVEEPPVPEAPSSQSTSTAPAEPVATQGPAAQETQTAEPVSTGGSGAETATAGTGARFVAGSDGTVTDLVPNAPDAISLGRYPAYVDNAAATGALTFNVGDAWEEMAARTDKFGGTGEGSEIWIRNTQFLDQAIARGSEIQLASDPFAAENAGSFFLREVGYLQKAGYQVQGNRMVLP